jgi:hypothetical protein
LHGFNCIFGSCRSFTAGVMEAAVIAPPVYLKTTNYYFFMLDALQ